MAYGRRGGRGRRSLPVNAEINLTNLIDVSFVLLIIFIITAPILQGGIEVELPQAESAPVISEDGVIVTVARGGKIYVGDVPVSTLDEFRTVYPEVVRNKNTKLVYLKADRTVVWDDIARVMGVMEKLGVAEVGLVLEPELR